MNSEICIQLVMQSRSGSRKAMLQLLRLAHTPVSYLCHKLIANEMAAEIMTRQVLSAMPRQLAALSDPAEFESWISRIAASRCMQALSQMERPARDENELVMPEIPAGNLDTLQTAKLVEELVDLLPEEPRLCLLLYSCTGLRLTGISQLTGFPQNTVLDYLNQAQKTINSQLRQYHKMGVHFDPIPALSTLVRTAMRSTENPKAAALMVRDMVPKTAAPAPTRKSFRIPRRMRIAIIAAAALLLAMLVTIVLLETL